MVREFIAVMLLMVPTPTYPLFHPDSPDRLVASINGQGPWACYNQAAFQWVDPRDAAKAIADNTLHGLMARAYLDHRSEIDAGCGR